MGSVKDLKVLQAPTAEKPGVARFAFSDRYSVFDWGEMPDHIAGKGQALALIGAWFLEAFAARGEATHYLGMVDSDGQVKQLKDLSGPSSEMEVSMVNVLKPPLNGDTYDYAAYKSRPGNILIPLEVIFRNSLPAGSSVFKRLEKGVLSLSDLGLTEQPSAGTKLSPPLVDVSTKLEVTDRYMPWTEAQEISGMTDDERAAVQKLTLVINDVITDAVAKLNLQHEDGKVEFGFTPDRRPMLVDVLGTPDECRFTMDGIAVSKEVTRIHYRNTEWYTKVEQAKQQDRQNWKSLVEDPPALPTRLADDVAALYQGFCNELTGRKWFKTRPLHDTVSSIKEQLEL